MNETGNKGSGVYSVTSRPGGGHKVEEKYGSVPSTLYPEKWSSYPPKPDPLLTQIPQRPVSDSVPLWAIAGLFVLCLLIVILAAVAIQMWRFR